MSFDKTVLQGVSTLVVGEDWTTRVTLGNPAPTGEQFHVVLRTSTKAARSPSELRPLALFTAMLGPDVDIPSTTPEPPSITLASLSGRFPSRLRLKTKGITLCRRRGSR